MTAPVTPLQFSYAPRTGVSLLLLPVSSILFHLLGAFALAFLSIKTLFPTEIYLADSLTLQIFAEMLPSQWRWPRPPFLIIQPTCSPAVACSVLFILPSLFFPHTINIIFYHITCMHAKSLQSCLTLCDFMGCSLPGFSVHGIFPGKSTGVNCHFLLQGIFLTQGLNPGLLHCRHTLYCLCLQGSTYLREDTVRE